MENIKENVHKHNFNKSNRQALMILLGIIGALKNGKAKIESGNFSHEKKNVIFLKRFGFFSYAEAAEWLWNNKSKIEFDEIYQFYDYNYLLNSLPRGTNFRQYIKSLSVNEREALPFKWCFVLDLNELMDNRDTFEYNKTHQRIYIAIDGNTKAVQAFHNIDDNKEDYADAHAYLAENFLKKKIAITEKLSFDQIADKLFYTGEGNEHLGSFYDQRTELNGKDISNIKFISADLDENGVARCIFSVVATKDGEAKQELTGNNGELKDNTNNEYVVEIHFCDFWDIIEDVGLSTPDDFTQKDVKALIELSEDVKVSCSCPGFWWQGTSYYLTQDEASLNPCNIQPKHWNKYRPNVKVCKHLEGTLKNIKFFSNQIAMSMKRSLIQQGYITKKPRKKSK